MQKQTTYVSNAYVSFKLWTILHKIASANSSLFINNEAYLQKP